MSSVPSRLNYYLMVLHSVIYGLAWAATVIYILAIHDLTRSLVLALAVLLWMPVYILHVVFYYRGQLRDREGTWDQETYRNLYREAYRDGYVDAGQRLEPDETAYSNMLGDDGELLETSTHKRKRV